MTDIYIIEPDPDCRGWWQWVHDDYNGPPDSRCGSAPTRHEAIDQARECAEDCAAEPEYDPGTDVMWPDIQAARAQISTADLFREVASIEMVRTMCGLVDVLALPLPSDLVLP